MELRLTKYDGKIGVAVSGGIDSMCLLHALCRSGTAVVVINVEHGIRGETSLRDTRFVRSYCEKHSIPFLCRSVNVPQNRLQGESTETCARRLRYAYFDELLANGTVDKIALAHHADDNAETVLMRIFRGTGLRGLSGITEHDGYIRPLLCYTRTQIEAYAHEYSIPFVSDETNFSSDYTRNFVRNDLIPLISSRFPDFVNAVSRLGEAANEADEYLYSAAPEAKEENGKHYLNGLFGLPKVIQKYAIIKTIRNMGILRDFETRHIELVLSLSEKPANTVIDLPFGLSCTAYGDGVIISKKHIEGFVPVPFVVGERYEFSGNAFWVVPGEGVLRGVSLDADRLPQGCVVRTRADGDIFKRVNGKRKLLGDFLNDLKLPKPTKDGLLVLAKGERVYAVFGIDTADEVKILPTTKTILHIEKEKTE